MQILSFLDTNTNAVNGTQWIYDTFLINIYSYIVYKAWQISCNYWNNPFKSQRPNCLFQDTHVAIVSSQFDRLIEYATFSI